MLAVPGAPAPPATSRGRRRLGSMAAILALAWCVGWTGACVPATARFDETLRTLPAGYGTLRQEEFSVVLRHDALRLMITPLDEEILRLAAPDTYARLSSLARQDQAGTRLLVTFHADAPGTPFWPERLELLQRGRSYRPVAIAPLTPEWGVQRLDARGTARAIYTFDASLALDRPFEVRYERATSDDWADIIHRLESERARVRGRAH